MFLPAGCPEGCGRDVAVWLAGAAGREMIRGESLRPFRVRQAVPQCAGTVAEDGLPV
jgi:hypothetical protein